MLDLPHMGKIPTLGAGFTLCAQVASLDFREVYLATIHHVNNCQSQ